MNGAGRDNKIEPLTNIGVGRHYIDETSRVNRGPYSKRHAPTSDSDDLNSNGVVDWSEKPRASIEGNPTISFSSTPQRVNTTPDLASTAPKSNGSTNPSQAQGSGSIAQQIIAKSQAEEQKKEEALKKYHSAWQKYYDEYYRNYYIAALEEQKAKFKEKQASVVDSREDDGTLSQSDVQDKLTEQINAKVESAGARPKHNWRQQPWFIPVLSAIIVVVIFLFLQYNSVVASWVMGFITPGASSTQTIIVGTGSNSPISDSPRIIIPKINVNAPVTYGLTSLDENTVQTALQNGPVNYPVNGASATPGQKGNTVILGHSSADAFAPGNYKFIFVQLNRLSSGDLFYLDYGQKRYTYRVTKLKVIEPNDLAALSLGTDKPRATLVTCDPPGTVARRLLVIADQVSPNPNSATDVVSTANESQPASISGKPKTLLEKLFSH